MSELDTWVSSAARTMLLDLFGQTVTYAVKPSAPGNSESTSSISAYRKHLPDLSEATARPHQRSLWVVSEGDVSAPKRGDTITDADSNVWTVWDILKPAGGLVGVWARIGQVRA